MGASKPAAVKTSEEITQELKKFSVLVRDNKKPGMRLYLVGAMAALEWAKGDEPLPLSERYENLLKAAEKEGL